jgi:hypothetical protein
MLVVLSERAMSLPDGDFSENGNRFVSGMCKPMLSLFDITVRQQLIPRPDDLQPPPVNMRCAGTKRVSFSEDDEADRHASFKMPLRIAIVMRTCLRILLTLIYILDGNPLSTTRTYLSTLTAASRRSSVNANSNSSNHAFIHCPL